MVFNKCKLLEFYVKTDKIHYLNISIKFKIPQLYEFCHHDVISSANDKELIDALFQFEGYHISFQRGFCSYLEQKRCFLFFSIQKNTNE